MNQPLPHYQRLKAFVTDEIEAGRLRPGDRIPSELDLIKRFGVSRMTANRALRERALSRYPRAVELFRVG